MIIHGFSKSEQLAKQLLDNGFYISFGKYLLQSRSFGTELETVFRNMPNDRFFLETDTVEESLPSGLCFGSKIQRNFGRRNTETGE